MTSRATFPTPWRVALLYAALAALWGCSPGEKPVDRAAVPPAPQARVERGRILLAQYQCGSCHAIPGVASARGQAAGSLAAFGRRSYIAGRLANGPELLAQWIAEPQALVPGTPMPSMGVPPAEARDMAAYLLDLK